MLQEEVKRTRKRKLIVASGVPVDTKAMIVASTEEIIERYSSEEVGDHEFKRHQAN